MLTNRPRYFSLFYERFRERGSAECQTRERATLRTGQGARNERSRTPFEVSRGLRSFICTAYPLNLLLQTFPAILRKRKLEEQARALVWGQLAAVLEGGKCSRIAQIHGNDLGLFLSTLVDPWARFIHLHASRAESRPHPASGGYKAMGKFWERLSLSCALKHCLASK